MPTATITPRPHSKPAVLFVRSTPAWREWVAELAEHDRAGSLAELIDRALMAYARDRDFRQLTPKR